MNPKLGLRTMIHGDDFVTVGPREGVSKFHTMLERRFEVKTKVIGSKPGEVTEGTVLNRVIRVSEDGWEYEPDQRHAEIIVKTLGLREAKGVRTPCEENKAAVDSEEEELQGQDATAYRGLAARVNYLAMDRADLQYAAKEVCRGMSKPTLEHWRRLKRIGRYLITCPRVITRFEFQEPVDTVEGYSDSDWAGCKHSARSTSGGVLMKGSHLIKSWSSTQRSIALSSAEAELVAAVKTSTELIGLLQLAEDWLLSMSGQVLVDSSAALGVVKRRGNGKLRHIRVGMLWIQERSESGDLVFLKVPGAINPADLMTKALTGIAAWSHMARIGQVQRDGRAATSLQVR